MPAWTARTYAYDNGSAEAIAHHESLASLLDPLTRWRITDLLDLAGAHCLEVGAGAGSMATWLADRVGPDGSVTATDTQPGLIPAHPRLTVLEHDITSPELPGGGYDLVHARLLLNHLPQRRQVLERLAAAVAPGGILLTEDFWPTSPHEIVAHAASEEDATLLRRFHLAHLRALSEHGNDRGWSRRALLAFLEEGLIDVQAVAYGSTWCGGSPGCQLLIAGTEQLREHLAEVGLNGDELDRAHDLLRDPGIVLHGHLLYSTSGQKPSATDGDR
jgi:SAM-dependent methyltransferase